MPFYNFKCNNGHITSVFRKIDNRTDKPECEECGEDTNRDIASENQADHVFEPYTDYNLTDDPEGVYIDSKKRKEQLKKKEGVHEAHGIQ